MASEYDADADAHRDRRRSSPERARRGWPGVALAIPLALGCTLAHGESLMDQLGTLNGIGYARSVDSMDGHALLGRLIGDSPRNQQEAGLLARIDGENLFVNARVVASNHSLGTQASRFNEAGVRYAFDNGITLTAGKRIDTLDTSQAFFPLGFFQKRAATADIYDRYGDVEGTPLVEAKWAGEQTTLQFIAGENRTLRNDVDNRDVEGATQLVRGAYNWSGGSAALLAGRRARRCRSTSRARTPSTRARGSNAARRGRCPPSSQTACRSIRRPRTTPSIAATIANTCGAARSACRARCPATCR
ncbi:uncharacterized protein BCN122_III0233 [Burkholderia cenocepacia]|nr:uncharacterized protein BCN122_III0233 [Burkholderia cenocepacia]